MNTPTINEHVGGAAERVAVALRDCDGVYARAIDMPRGSDAESAARAARLALVCARRAGWWRVLARATYSDPATHDVYGLAVVLAHDSERNSARFWREASADWRARSEGRPTSDAAGALSNWDELGVTA